MYEEGIGVREEERDAVVHRERQPGRPEAALADLLGEEQAKGAEAVLEVQNVDAVLVEGVREFRG